MAYTLWIIPPEPIAAQLQEWIKKFSAEFGGQVFMPHMTIVENLDKDLAEMEQKTKQLAEKHHPFEVSFGPVSFSTTHDRNVFVRVNSSAPLMQLSLDAREIFGLENNIFMPHMSLMYGDHDMVTREKAAAEVTLSLPPFTAESLVITPAVIGSDEKHTVVPFSPIS